MLPEKNSVKKFFFFFFSFLSYFTLDPLYEATSVVYSNVIEIWTGGLRNGIYL